MCRERTVFNVAAAVFISMLLAGCYPKPVGPVGPEGNRLTWAKMTMAQKKAHMAQAVLPRAAAIFKSWRPERYAKIDCVLCHDRQGLASGTFHMPTAHLPRLSGELLLGPEFEKHPETTRLKLDRLVPEMAEALGLKGFSVLTRKGFGCYSCHLGPNGPMFGN